MRYFLIAGEPSGDQHGSTLMRSIRAIDPNAEFRFFGGDLMEKEGKTKAVIHIRDLAFMGFTQLLTRLWRISKTFRTCKREIIGFAPHSVIPIDYGGFNLRIIRWLNQNKIKAIYYITPKVWAWMPSRARRLARYAGKSLCVLPFEEDFLKKYGVNCTYVGNPVKDYVAAVKGSDLEHQRSEFGLSGKPVIAILPGSRRQEISRLLPVMGSVIIHFTDYQFVIAGHANFPESFYHDKSGGQPVQVVYGKTLELLRISAAALVTSGTATLEAALIGTPQVVCYKTAPVSYLIARLLIHVRYISLVNLILGFHCVTELIQNQCTRENIKVFLHGILGNEAIRTEMLAGYGKLDELIGDQDASATAAAIVCRLSAEA